MKDKARNGNNDALMERVVQAGKCKDKNFESSSILSKLLCVDSPFSKGIAPLSPFSTSFSHFLLCLPTSI